MLIKTSEKFEHKFYVVIFHIFGTYECCSLLEKGNDNDIWRQVVFYYICICASLSGFYRLYLLNAKQKRSRKLRLLSPGKWPFVVVLHNSVNNCIIKLLSYSVATPLLDKKHIIYISAHLTPKGIKPSFPEVFGKGTI